MVSIALKVLRTFIKNMVTFPRPRYAKMVLYVHRTFFIKKERISKEQLHSLE